jgi:hypothetical protein
MLPCESPPFHFGKASQFCYHESEMASARCWANRHHKSLSSQLGCTVRLKSMKAADQNLARNAQYRKRRFRRRQRRFGRPIGRWGRCCIERNRRRDFLRGSAFETIERSEKGSLISPLHVEPSKNKSFIASTGPTHRAGTSSYSKRGSVRSIHKSKRNALHVYT